MISQYCQSKGIARFTCAQAGCSYCMETLLQENIRLVWRVLLRQAPGKADYADLLQEGRIGLWQAILHFDPGLGYAFSTYAYIAIRNHIWIEVRRSLKVEGWQVRQFDGDHLTAVISAWQDAQIHQALGEGLEYLPVRLRQLINWRYGLDGFEPQTYIQIGQVMGLTHERVRQLHNDALVLLRLPMFSIRLRSICERQSRSDYRHALRQNQRWQRKSRERR